MSLNIHHEIELKKFSEFSHKELVNLNRLYCQNKFRSNVDTFISEDLIACIKDKDTIVASRRFKKHTFANASNEKLSAFQCADTITDVSHRGKGFSSILLKSVLNGDLCDFFFNFPNEASLPMYLKNNFSIIDYHITFINTGTIANQMSPDLYKDISISDHEKLYKYKLNNGLLSKIPFHAFGKKAEGKPVLLKVPKLINLPLSRIWNANKIASKSMLFSMIRPVTFFSKRHFDVNKIYINAASYDTSNQI